MVFCCGNRRERSAVLPTGRRGGQRPARRGKKPRAAAGAGGQFVAVSDLKLVIASFLKHVCLFLNGTQLKSTS